MAASDWQTFAFGAGVDPGSATDPISGDQSLRISCSALTGGYITAKDSSGLTKGILKGRLRSIIKASNNKGETSLICMMSQEDVTATGSCYSAAIEGTLIRIRKHTTGLDAAGTTLASASFTRSNDTTYPVELLFFADVSAFGGTRLVVQAGTGGETDYATLAEVVAFTDTASPLLVSVAEGLGAVERGGFSTVHHHDLSELYISALL